MNSISKEKYLELYQLLDVSPLEGDCGDLCDKACCKMRNDDFGIYLLPNEESVFTGEEDWLIWEKQNPQDYFFPESWQQDVYFVRCTKSCPRDKRPLQCRTFPLAPHLDKYGKLHIIWETLQLPYKCPILNNSEKRLQPLFIKNTYLVWQELIKDPLIRDLVLLDSNERINDNLEIISLQFD